MVDEAGAAAAGRGAGGVAFVLGGGGLLGANEVGMLRALLEAGVRPDLVLGTSVGAVNGALVATGFTAATVDRLVHLWSALGDDDVFGGTLRERVTTLARSRTHLHGNERLRALLVEHLPARRFDELAVPFQCVAASIERAGPRWFGEGPLVDAVLASAAVPGLLPPVEVGGEHCYDGGLVHSIPVGRAIALGARTVYVLQVGRVDEPLAPPRSPLQVALVAFEIARRHRYVEELAAVPDGVDVHVLPTGETERLGGLAAQLRYRRSDGVPQRIARAHEAAAGYLAQHRA